MEGWEYILEKVREYIAQKKVERHITQKKYKGIL